MKHIKSFNLFEANGLTNLVQENHYDSIRRNYKTKSLKEIKTSDFFMQLLSKLHYLNNFQKDRMLTEQIDEAIMMISILAEAEKIDGYGPYGDFKDAGTDQNIKKVILNKTKTKIVEDTMDDLKQLARHNHLGSPESGEIMNDLKNIISDLVENGMLEDLLDKTKMKNMI